MFCFLLKSQSPPLCLWATGPEKKEKGGEGRRKKKGRKKEKKRKERGTHTLKFQPVRAACRRTLK